MKKSMGWRSRLLLCVMMLTSIAALPTTIIFFIGMLPTVMSRFTNKGAKSTRVLTVGFMNFAACFPFWFQLMRKGHNFSNAVDIITDPLTIVIMYGGAVMGYMIEWALAGFVAGLMVSRGKARLEKIKEIQAELVDRWGPEVSGDLPLDINGFPIDAAKH